jgi:hypothetical protein
VFSSSNSPAGGRAAGLLILKHKNHTIKTACRNGLPECEHIVFGTNRRGKNGIKTII